MMMMIRYDDAEDLVNDDYDLVNDPSLWPSGIDMHLRQNRL